MTLCNVHYHNLQSPSDVFYFPLRSSSQKMSLNSSSVSNGDLPYCFNSELRLFITVSMSSLKTLLLLPLCSFILFQGCERWRRQRSFKTVSHSDLFAYHLAAMEMFGSLGFICSLCGKYINSLEVLVAGVSSSSISFYGEMFFHVLTCVERYLAVVHPVIYRGLRNTRGVQIRNITIGCVWLLCFGLIRVHTDLTSNYFLFCILCFLVFAITVVSFCSLSVLHVLIRPAPGEGSGEKVDPLKRKAFVTIAVISSVLWLWLIGLFIAIALSNSPLLSESVSCLLTGSAEWFNLPPSLVLPLLYLHRAGKLCCWKKPK